MKTTKVTKTNKEEDIDNVRRLAIELDLANNDLRVLIFKYID